ncbi:MAG: hypothetical protein ACYTEZ_08255 [Planctomycetota bacterium]|jgi:hypothetical protein
MSRRRCLIVVFALAAACGDGTPIADVPLRITAGAQQVELGKAFPLIVVRVWRHGQAPADWSGEALAPLAVRLVETARREDDRRVEERRRYQAYAFTLGDLTVPVPSGEPLALAVRRSLDPAAPGPAELPGEPLPAPFPWGFGSAVGGALLAAVVLLVRRRRRRPAAPPPGPVSEAAAPAPHRLALERLARLRAQQPRTHEEVQSFHVEASGLVRDYVGERFGVGTAERTTEELLALALRASPLLAEVLRPCDLVKFARHRPTAAERGHLLDTAETFVRETT